MTLSTPSSGHAPGLTYNRNSYCSAYEDTAATLGSVEGLVLALYEIGSEHDGLNNPDPTSNAILSLMGSSRRRWSRR
jgi:hypothetical protein